MEVCEYETWDVSMRSLHQMSAFNFGVRLRITINGIYKITQTQDVYVKHDLREENRFFSSQNLKIDARS